MDRNQRRLAKKADKHQESEPFSVAVAHHLAGRLAEAEASYRSVPAHNPRHVDALNNLSVILIGSGRFDEAEASSRRALQIKPNNAVAHNNLGVALSELGRLEEAVACYYIALEITPDYANAHLNLGNALRDLGRQDDAITSYRRALKVRPDFAEVHSNLGNVLRDLGRLEEAEVNYRRALAIKPNLIEAHSNLGNTLCGLGRLNEAETSCRHALELRPDYAEAHINLGNALLKLGRPAEAAEHYERSLAIKPDSAHAHNPLAYALSAMARTGHREAAEERARAWIRITPNNPTAQHILAALSGNAERLQTRASDGYVASLFDSFAKDFDAVLTGLNYKAPTLISEVLARELPSGPFDILDAGCGTGLVGQLLRSRARSLVGVDLSRSMLAQAAKRGIYDHLHQSELTAFLATNPTTFDLIVAVDVLIYFGDVTSLFTTAATALRPGGWLAFSAEELANVEDGDWQLRPHGRYCQSEAYLRRCLASAGMAAIHVARDILRSENRQDVVGLIVLAQRVGEFTSAIELPAGAEPSVTS